MDTTFQYVWEIAERLRKDGLRGDSISTKGLSDVFHHATSEIASRSKLGLGGAKKIPGEDLNCPGPPPFKWMKR